MSTFRNTVSAVFDSFLTHMESLVGTSGSGSELSIRSVNEGETILGAFPIPSVTIQLLDSKVAGRTDADKKWDQSLRIRVTSEVRSTRAATSEILSKIAQVEDKIEAYTKPDGVLGFEDAEWAITFSVSSDGGNFVIADSTRKFSVMVSRGAN